MTDPASAIKLEVHQLVDRQIETLRQPSGLTTSDRCDYRDRSEKVVTLYRELDQMRKSQLREAIAQSILRLHPVRS